MRLRSTCRRFAHIAVLAVLTSLALTATAHAVEQVPAPITCGDIVIEAGAPASSVDGTSTCDPVGINRWDTLYASSTWIDGPTVPTDFSYEFPDDSRSVSVRYAPATGTLAAGTYTARVAIYRATLSLAPDDVVPPTTTFDVTIKVVAATTCEDSSIRTVVDHAASAPAACTGEGHLDDVMTQPAHGAVTGPDETGAFTYTPAPGYAGPDSYVLRATVGRTSDTSTVSVTVAPRPTPLVCRDVTVDALAPATSMASAASCNGRALADGEIGSARIEFIERPVTDVHYVSHASYPGDGVSFRVDVKSERPGIPAGVLRIRMSSRIGSRVTGGEAVYSETSTFIVTFNIIGDAPTCTDDAVSTVAPASVTRASTCAGMRATTSIDAQPANGALAGPDANGAFTYTPKAGFSGTDSYRLRSTNIVGSATSTVTVTVAPAPVVGEPVAVGPDPAPAPAPAPVVAGGPDAAAAPIAPTLRLASPKFARLAAPIAATCTGSTTLASCSIVASSGGKVVATGTATGIGVNARVTLKVNALGRALAARSIGGIPVKLVATGRFASGTASAVGTSRLTPVQQRIIPPMVILFGANDAELSTFGGRYLAAIGKLLAASGARGVTCEGFVSTTGLGGNTELAAERAKVACAVLRANGVRTATRVVSRDTDAPRTSNEAEATRRFNRRFELVVRY